MTNLRRIFLCAGVAAGLAVGIVYAQSQPAGLPATGNSGYPPGATPAGASQTATTGGITISIAATPGQFSYLCGIGASPGSATTAITLAITITNSNVTGGWTVGAPVTAVGVTGSDFQRNFAPCLRSNTVNQNLSVSIGALGAGGVNQALSIWGYTR